MSMVCANDIIIHEPIASVKLIKFMGTLIHFMVMGPAENRLECWLH